MELIADMQTHFRHQLFISALNPTSPIVLERRAWPPLSLALPFSSSLFDSEKESGWRRSRRAVEGASAISPSLPVLNSLMKFRSEEQWRKHSDTVGCNAHLTCLSILVFLCVSPCLNLISDFGFSNCLTLLCLVLPETALWNEKQTITLTDDIVHWWYWWEILDRWTEKYADRP